MMRWFLWSLAGLLLGVLAHLVSIIALPRLSAQTGFQRIANVARADSFTLLTADKTPLPRPDPAIVTAFCRFNLANGAMRLHVPLTSGFLSISFYTSAGLNFYALTDRAAANGAIDLTLYTPAQLAQVRANEGPDQPGALRLQAPQERGLVALRALIPEPGEKAETERALSAARCGPA
ncbi:hypothetical protein LMIY3S_03040 [Labrys miyagiensis]